MKITKIKPWAVYFENKQGIKLLLHVASDGYEHAIRIYARNVNENGNYNLDCLNSCIYGDSYLKGFNYKKGMTYKQIGNKELVGFLIDTFGVKNYQFIRDCHL